MTPSSIIPPTTRGQAIRPYCGSHPMDVRGFCRAGHLPTLICAFLYFTVSCMAWMMVGALANSIIPDLGELSDSRKGLMVAVPVLGGALLRLVLGPLADHIGPRRRR